MRDSAAGVIRAAPRPWAARAAIRAAAVEAKPLKREAVVKMAMPVRNTRRRGSKSAIRPPIKRPPPDTRR